jgi:hypothetical protein
MNLAEKKADFERCWPWLWVSLCAYGPTHTKEQLWERIVTGKAYLWSTKGCVIVGELVDHPIGFRSFNYWLQGGDLGELLELHPQIEDWAKAAGCARVIGRGRDGWSRVMNGDWHKGPTTRTKWLDEPPLVVRRALVDEVEHHRITAGLQEAKPQTAEVCASLDAGAAQKRMDSA